MRITNLLATSLIAVLVLCGCSSQNVNTINNSEVKRLTQLPKIQGTEVDGNLGIMAEFPGTPVHILGTVDEIQNPRTSTMPEGERFEWVPIFIKVQSSNQSALSDRIMLRLYPVADSDNSLLRLSIGDRVIALASKSRVDDNGLSGFTLGSLYGVELDGTIKQLDSGQTIEGNLGKFQEVLGLN